MRTHHIVAIAVVIAIGLGIKMFFFPNRPADAQSPAFTSASMNVFQMHLEHPNIKNLPEQRVAEPF